MPFPDPPDGSPFNSAKDWWIYAIADAYRELFAGTVAPDFTAETAEVQAAGAWSNYWNQLQVRSAVYGGESNAARLAKVLKNQGTILSNLAAIKTKLGI